MNKKTALENLVFQSGLTQKQFADKIGVKYSTFENQLRNQKHLHVHYAFEYARILGVDTVSGYSVDGVWFELVIGNKK